GNPPAPGDRGSLFAYGTGPARPLARPRTPAAQPRRAGGGGWPGGADERRGRAAGVRALARPPAPPASRGMLQTPRDRPDRLDHSFTRRQIRGGAFAAGSPRERRRPPSPEHAAKPVRGARVRGGDRGGTRGVIGGRTAAAQSAATGNRLLSGRTFQALANHNFRLFASGQIVSQCGTWLQR